MNLLIIYLIIVIVFLLYRIHILKKENEELYNNYTQCLMALAEYDPELKKYLEEQND